MSTSIESLPPELLMRIFEYFSDDRKRIGGFRLVSKIFKETSSPYLITKLVFAKRLTTLAKAAELACHPYFSRYITEITYDLSFWKFDSTGPDDDPNETSALDSYSADCLEAEDIGIRHFFDEEWHRHTRAEDLFFSSLDDKGLSKQPNAALAFLSGTGDDCPEHPIHPRDDYPFALVEAEDPDHPDMDRIGCFRSFLEYKRHRVMAKKLVDRGDYIMILADIASKLPKLRAVRFTDYRGLARELETYSDLCTRLFGNMLQPERWNWQLDVDGMCTVEAINALLVLRGNGPEAGLQSISFGPHGYEMVAFPEETLITHKEAHYLEFQQIEPCNEDDEDPESLPERWLLSRDWKSMFRNLRTARLPFLIGEAPRRLEMASTMINALPDSIRHLATSVRGPIEALFAEDRLDEQMLKPFDHLVSKKRFPHLESLELEGWCIHLETLKKFLLEHAASLRELHLINIQFATSEWHGNNHLDLEAFSEFVATRLNLTGIEIVEVEVWGPVEPPDSPSDDLDWQGPGLPWLRPDHPDLPFWEGDKLISSVPDYVTEKACLQGRRNMIHRRRMPTRLAQKGDELGSIPSHY